MSEYLTTESEISELSEFGDEYHDLIAKNGNLQNEIEILRKQMKDKEFESETTINILNFENENLKQTIKSYDELIDFYKSSQEDRVNNPNMARKSTSSNLIKTNLDLIQKISELESRNFNLEQNEHNLRREIFSLNSTINQLKFDLEKRSRDDGDSMGEEKIRETNLNDRKQSEGNSLIDVNDLQELLQEIDDLKKENAEISERALNMLAEKELVILELRSEFAELSKQEEDKAKDHNNKQNMNTPSESLKECSTCGKTRGSEVDLPELDLNIAMPSDKQLFIRYNQLEEEYCQLKKEIQEKENLWDHERDRLQKYTVGLENSHRSIMNDFESEISKLKNEIFNLELEKGSLEKELIKDKSSIETEIAEYSKIIKSLEDQREKSEHNSRSQINLLKTELHQLDLANTTMREQIFSLEKQINDLKNENIRKIESIQEKWKFDSNMKENENSKMKAKIETLEKEKESLKKECEQNRRVIDKTKNEYKDLMDQLRKLKENNEEEKRKWEEKTAQLEQTQETEKYFYKNQIAELKNSMGKSYNSNTNMSINVNLNNSGIENEENSSLLRNRIQILENEVQKLNSLIKLRENKNANVFRLNGEVEILKKEKSKLKAEMEQMKEMYEIQIKDLLMKVNLKTIDSSSGQRRSSIKPGNFNAKQLMENMDLEDKLERLKVENKFLSEQLELLKKELDNTKTVKENQIRKIKEDLEDAEKIVAGAKISMAQVIFEKDSEVMKYKRLCKKLKLRLTNATSHNEPNLKIDKNNYNSSSATPKKKNSFFQSLFK